MTVATFNRGAHMHGISTSKDFICSVYIKIKQTVILFAVTFCVRLVKINLCDMLKFLEIAQSWMLYDRKIRMQMTIA